jgi:PAS domain S-box-containing protein
VASSYANQLQIEAKKIQKIFENTQDGIFSFDMQTKHLREINPMGARMLLYEREELLGRDISVIWPSGTELTDFVSCVSAGNPACKREVLLKRKDGKPSRCIVSAILTTDNLVLCSAFDVSNDNIANEEIRQTLEDLERQVRDRTAHLEKINEELKAEILERRRFEREILPGDQNDERNRREP